MSPSDDSLLLAGALDPKDIAFGVIESKKQLLLLTFLHAVSYEDLQHVVHDSNELLLADVHAGVHFSQIAARVFDRPARSESEELVGVLNAGC